jgi:hypothetical protein
MFGGKLSLGKSTCDAESDELGSGGERLDRRLYFFGRLVGDSVRFFRATTAIVGKRSATLSAMDDLGSCSADNSGCSDLLWATEIGVAADASHSSWICAAGRMFVQLGGLSVGFGRLLDDQ